MVAPIWSGALKEEARLLGSRPRLFGLCHCDSHSGAALGLVVGRAALAWPATHLYEGRLYLSRVNDYRTLGSQLCVERLSSSGPIVSPCDLYYSCCDKFTIMSAHTCAAFNSYQTLIIHLVCMTHLFVTCTRVYFVFLFSSHLFGISVEFIIIRISDRTKYFQRSFLLPLLYISICLNSVCFHEICSSGGCVWFPSNAAWCPYHVWSWSLAEEEVAVKHSSFVSVYVRHPVWQTFFFWPHISSSSQVQLSGKFSTKKKNI